MNRTKVMLYRKNRQKKIKLPDAIILAMASYLDADLITNDWKDLQGLDSDVKVIGIDTWKI